MLAEAGPALLLLVGLLGGGIELLGDEWQRVRCAHLAFEAAHAALWGGHVSGASARDVGAWVEGEARCGRAREVVRLWKLENGPW